MSTSLIVLVIYILLLAPAMLVGFVFARRKMFRPYHKFTMTGITLFNWVLIGLVMAISYGKYVAPDLPANLSDFRNLIATIHLVTGGLAQLLATYLVLLMWTENTALERLVIVRIKNIKTPMRLTLVLWLTTVVLGLGIYFTWYGQPAPADTTPPAATEEATQSVDPAATEEASQSGNPSAAETPVEPAATEETSGS